ncbi:MAG: GDSL-type esterase/lipase family protein [Patescibacteria group bacterium]
MEKIICIFGTSVTWGAWDSEKGGWVNRLKLYFESLDEKDEKKVFIYNLGIESNTTENILKRFNNEAEERFWGDSDNENYKNDNICIFDIGKNDSIYVGSKNNNWVKLDKFEKNLNKLIKEVRKFSSKIIFVGPARIDESETIPWEETGESYCNENIEKYNLVIKSVCNEQNIHFIPMIDLLNIKNDLEDGLHPNVQGHRKMFERVKDFLLKNKLVDGKNLARVDII